MRIDLTTFAGMVRRVSPRLLQPDQAQFAANVRLQSGDLVAWHAAGRGPDLDFASRVETLYRFANRYWFQWSQAVDVVRGPIPDDDSHRTYFTGLDKPRFTDLDLAVRGDGPFPVDSYQLGLPEPPTPPAVEVQGQASEDNPALVETRAYTYTLVSKFDEEGPSVSASGLVDVAPGQNVKLSGFDLPSGEYVIDKIRIYRTASSGASAAFLFVDEIGAFQNSYVDITATARLGEPLPSEDWIAPPEDLHSLVVLPNGSLAGASGLDILISEPYQPHAWPRDYRHTAPDTVIGLGVIANELVVLTERAPYIITGANPASMTMTQAGSSTFSCVSKPSIVASRDAGVLFAGPDGLYVIAQGGAQNVTESMLTPRQWQDYAPSSMRGVIYEGRYYGFYDTGDQRGCLVYDPGGLLYELDLDARAPYRDPESGRLYYVDDRGIRIWDQADPIPYRWRSKRYELSIPVLFNAARVRAESYGQTTLRLIGDGETLASIEPQPGVNRLPMTRRATVYALEIEGTDRVYDVSVAEHVDELRS